MMYHVLSDLRDLYRTSGIECSDEYYRLMPYSLNQGLSYSTPAMYGITQTVLSSDRMIAYNLIQNSIDEAKGAARIQVIIDRYVDEPDLAKRMNRHVGEELKHSRMFKNLVAETGYEVDESAFDPRLTEEVLDFDDDLHSFICRVHSIELRSWTVLRIYQSILRETRQDEFAASFCRALSDVMADEMYHVTYTGQVIDGWLRQGVPRIADTLVECLQHTDRETWQDMQSMLEWLADNYGILANSAPDEFVHGPSRPFVVGDLALAPALS